MNFFLDSYNAVMKPEMLHNTVYAVINGQQDGSTQSSENTSPVYTNVYAWSVIICRPKLQSAHKHRHKTKSLQLLNIHTDGNVNGISF